jgi:hypothetical protein
MISPFSTSYRSSPFERAPLYVAEFQFRYNNRESADIFGNAIGHAFFAG